MGKVLVILSHGSRSLDFQAGFNEIVNLVKEKRKDIKVYGANMELCEPTIENVVSQIIEENKELKTIAIVPFFLFEGIHIKEDIPEIIEQLKEKHKGINFVFGKPLGADPVLAEILVERAKEIV